MAGRKIDDHSFWAGSGSKKSVFPEGAKVKHEMSEEGAGGVKHYEDTTELIARTQGKSKAKIHGHEQREGYRY